MHRFSRARRTSPLALLSIAILLPGCGEYDSGSNSGQSNRPSANDRDLQTAFRIRSDFDAGLNEDQGWAAAINRPAKVGADSPFRIRLEVVASGESGARNYSLQMRINGGEWRPLRAEDFPYPLKEYELPAGASDGEPADSAWRFELGSTATSRWTADDQGGHWLFVAGAQPLLALARTEIFWQPSELSAEVRLDPDSHTGVGLVVDYRDPANHSRVDLNTPETVRLIHVEDGRPTLLAERRAEIEPGRWIEFSAVVEAGAVTIEIDGETLIDGLVLPSEDPGLRLGVYLPEGGSAAFRSLMLETGATTPRSSIVRAAGFAHGEPTTDLLAASDRPFTGGAGVSFAERTPGWIPDGGHGEWSFPIVVRRFADEAALNEDGDTFDFRLVDSNGKAVEADAPASVTLEVSDGHLGGTFVETPMRIGPWQAENGDLYFIMEPSETWNRMMVVKSTDHGRTWREVDGANRPETGDLEGLGSVYSGGRIHILHQVSDRVLYHAFDTSEHANDPDAWAIVDEPVAAPPQPPTQVADLAVRSDGSVVAVYGAGNDIGLRVRSAGGVWGEEQAITDPERAVLSGPSLVRDSDDVVHLAYTAGDGSGWYRRIEADNAVSGAVRFTSELGMRPEDIGAILPLIELAESGSIGIVYRTRDGRLHARRHGASGAWTAPTLVSERRVIQNAVDSDQVAADAIAVGDAIHVLFAESGTGTLYHASGRAGDWSIAEPIVTDTDVQWVRGALIESDRGDRFYGFVYDAGSNGGSGMNRFGRIPLESR